MTTAHAGREEKTMGHTLGKRDWVHLPLCRVRATLLPERTLDTMSDAIALSPPSGKMSKAARKRANERLRQALFGDGFAHPTCEQETDRERLLHQAAELRVLAEHGMCPRKYRREAERLEAQASEILGR